jgi:bacillithiol synthase
MFAAEYAARARTEYRGKSNSFLVSVCRCAIGCPPSPKKQKRPCRGIPVLEFPRTPRQELVAGRARHAAWIGTVSNIRIIDTPLAFGALAAAGVAGNAPRGWYADIPRSVEEWGRRIEATQPGNAEWLERLRPAFGEGARLLDRVAGGNGVVVTTGQQPGLFGGPLYTWHKALSALELAATIERETGVPVTPVFWAATDDADFAEGASTVVATENGPQRLEIVERPGDGVPMAHAPLGAEIADAMRQLEAAAGSVSDPRALTAARAFRETVTLGDAYVAMLRELLEPLGIAVLDASHECVGVAAHGVMASALARAPRVHGALVARRDEARVNGFTTTVDVDRALSLVFEWVNGAGGLPVKRRLTIDEAERAGRITNRLSPNVLLRPVMERAILPTIAYMAGPGELAYFGQVSAVADALEVAQPLALPRWSGMIIPNDVSETLSRLGIAHEDLKDPHAAEGRLARSALSAPAKTAIEELRAAIEQNIPRLDGALTPEARDGAKNQLTLRVDRLERRLVAAAKHREAATMRKVGGARAVLYPFGKPQERALNIVPLWSKYGDELIGGIRNACAAHAARLIERAAVRT